MRTLVWVVCIAGASALAQARLVADDQPKNIDERATHEQGALIKVDRPEENRLKINAFCLNADGNILAACGNGPGEVRVFDGDGEFLRFWEIPVKPESINTAPDGTVLVAGSGKLFRYSIDGEQLQQADSPHATAINTGAEKLREHAIEQLKQQARQIANPVEQYRQLLEQLETKKKKDGLNDQEQRILDILPTHIERLAERQQNSPKPQEITEEAIQQQVKFMTEHKMRMCSISADDDHVYVATPALAGWGFEVWRLDPDFQNGEVVVSELRGCCGQMDVQCCKSGVYVAENSRHRVVRFTSDGEQTATWGKQDRTGLDGFTSCCNPMNVCFNKSGDVYTAESNTGRIKRFSADGDFLEFVGDVKLVPGCKNVSIAVSSDDERVYMLDITRNHIVLMKRKTSEDATDSRAGAE